MTDSTTDLAVADTPPPSSPPGDLGSRSPTPERIRVRSWNWLEAAELGGVALAALSLTWLVYEQLTGLSGGLGFFLSWFATFLVLDWIVQRQRHDKMTARDRLVTVAIGGLASVIFAALTVIIGYVIYRGYGTLRLQFLTVDQRHVGPLSPPTAGGGLAAIVGTLEQVGLALVISVPLGVGTAVFLSEIKGKLARLVRIFVEAMNGIPSILAAIFISQVWLIETHHQQSGFAVALALSISMMPTVARTCEVVLRLVPGGLREGSLALGGLEWRMVRSVVLPTARSGIITSIVLGMARVVGEAAPALIVGGESSTVNWNPFHGPQDDLPYFVFRLVREPIKAENLRAWTGALVLIMLVMVLFVLARMFSGTWNPRAWVRRPIARWQRSRSALDEVAATSNGGIS